MKLELKNLENLQRQEKQEVKEQIKTTTAEIQEIEFKKNILFVEVMSLEAYEAIEIACKRLATECKEGLQDVLKQFYYLRKIEDIVQKTIKEMQFAVDLAINMPKDELRRHSLELGYTAEILDYSEDSFVNELEKKLKERKEKIKLDRTIIDKETGEIKPIKIKTPSKPYLKVCK
jgi:hypothetical protein